LLKPGDTLRGQRGPYTVTRKLAEGGMGVVHLGRNASGDAVVIKEPRITGKSDQDQLCIQKLGVETAILKSLSHKHIMRYEDSYVDSGLTYLVVEYIDGETWENAFKNNPASEGDADKHIIQVLDALAYMHDQNVIYRDFKPRNVMLSKRGENKIIDFGAAKYFYTQIQDPKYEHTVIFSFGWTAPEQQWGGASFQSDIYAAGATLFYLLTGKPPALWMDGRGQIKPPSAINPRAGRLSNVVMKAMDLDPNKRYQTARDMINDIQGKLSAIGEPYVICGSHKHVISDEATVGRAGDCDIPISDPVKFISKRHAKIYMRGGQYWIKDLGSLNGTFIAQDPSKFQKLAPNSPRALKDNDIIALCYNSALGPYMTLKFKMPGAS